MRSHPDLVLMTPAASSLLAATRLLAPLSCRGACWWHVVALTRERSADPPEPMAVMHLTRAKAHSTPAVDAAPQLTLQLHDQRASSDLEHNQEDAATRSDMAQRFRNPSIGCTESACQRSAPSENPCLWFSDAQWAASRMVQKGPRCGRGIAKLKNRATLGTAHCEKTRGYTGAFLEKTPHVSSSWFRNFPTISNPPTK